MYSPLSALSDGLFLFSPSLKGNDYYPVQYCLHMALFPLSFRVYESDYVIPLSPMGSISLCLEGMHISDIHVTYGRHQH
jgi:hypothetical protein